MILYLSDVEQLSWHLCNRTTVTK